MDFYEYKITKFLEDIQIFGKISHVLQYRIDFFVLFSVVKKWNLTFPSFI